MAARKSVNKDKRIGKSHTRLRLAARNGHSVYEEEHYYRDLVENANDTIAVFSPEGMIEWVNRGAERLLGWTAERLIGQHYRIVTTPASALLVEERNRLLLTGKKPSSSIFEAEVVHKEGHLIPVEARTRMITDRRGKLRGFQGIYRDIRDRKARDAAERQHERFYHAVLENASDIIVVLDRTGTVTYSSPSCRQVLGYSELHGLSSFGFVHPEDLPTVTERFQTLLASPKGTTVVAEMRVQHQKGSWRRVEATATNLLEDESVRGIVINSRDITTRKEIEERYKFVSESISDYAFSFSIDEHGELSLDWLTESFADVTGYAPDELMNKKNPLHVYIHPEDLPRVIATVQGLQPDVRTTYTFRIVRKEGEVRWIQSRAKAVADSTGRLIHFYGAARDITETRQQEQQQRESESRYQRLVEHAPDVIYTMNPEGILTDLNQSFFERTGRDPKEWIGQSFGPLIHPEDLERAVTLFQRVLAGEALSEFRLRIQTQAGDYRLGEFRAVPQYEGDSNEVTSVLGISRDITERIQAEEELKESQNLLSRIADTIREVLYLYDLTTQRIVYINSRVLAVLGYSPEQVLGKDAAAVQALIHSEDLEKFAHWEERCRQAADVDVVEVNYRVRHVNGAYGWFQVRASVCTRHADGSPARMLGIATDVTASNTARTMTRTRVMNLAEIPERLRRFREQLNLTQAQFGQAFGGLDAKQIGNYERGDSEPSFQLLAAVHHAGYPLEVVFGASPTPVLDETCAYLATHQSSRRIEVRLAEALVRLLRGEQDQMERLITELGMTTKVLNSKERQLLEQLSETATGKS